MSSRHPAQMASRMGRHLLTTFLFSLCGILLVIGGYAQNRRNVAQPFQRATPAGRHSLGSMFSTRQTTGVLQQIARLSGENLTGAVIRGQYVYAAGNGLETVIYDIANPQQPQRVGVLLSTAISSVRQVVLAGDYLYLLAYGAAANETDGKMLVVNISAPANPVQVGVYAPYGGTVNHLVVANGYAYLGVTNNTTHVRQLDVVNVLTPANPGLARSIPNVASEDGVVASSRLYLAEGTTGLTVWRLTQADYPSKLGTQDTPGFAQAVAVSGSYAYVADKDTGSGTGGLRVIDSTDPLRMSIKTTVSGTPAAPLQVAGATLYVPDYFTGGTKVYSLTNPASPQATGNIAGLALSIEAATNHLLTSSNNGFDLWDITTPALAARLGGYVPPQPWEFAYSDPYVVSLEGGMLVVYDVTSPANMTQLARTPLTGAAYLERIVADGTLLVVSGTQAGSGQQVVWLISLANPHAPQVLGSYPVTASAIVALALRNHFLYIGTNDLTTSLLIVDVNDPAHPRQVFTDPARLRQATSGSMIAMTLAGQYGYFLYHGNHMVIMDLTNPTAPVVKSTLALSATADLYQVAATSSLAIVETKGGNLLPIDIHDPANPTPFALWTNPNAGAQYLAPPALAADGNYAYLSLDGGGLQVVDLSSPQNLAVVGAYDGMCHTCIVAGQTLFAAGASDGLIALRNTQVSPTGRPAVFSVSPNVVSSLCTVKLFLSGLNYYAGTQAWLEKTGQQDIIGANIALDSTQFLSADFPLTGAAAGAWNLVVRNTNGSTARLDNAVQVMAPPDVTVGSPTISPAQNIAEGESVVASVILTNIGGGAATGALQVSFTAWGQTVIGVHAGGLAPDEAATITVTMKAKAGDAGSLHIVADPNQQVAEANETNNTADLALPAITPPDLTITSVTYKPTTLHAGDTVAVCAHVKNLSSALGQGSYVAYLIDGTQVKQEPFTALAAGGECDVWIHTSVQPGMQQILARVDPDNLVTESSKTNNELSTTLPVIGKPNLKATAFTITPEAPTGGSNANLRLTVKNIGADLGGPFTVEFRADGIPIGRTGTDTPLPTGTEVTLSPVTWRVINGNHTLTAIIDPDNQLIETDKTDNSLQKSLAVQASDLVLENLHFDTPPLYANLPVKVCATLRNLGDGGAGASLAGLFVGAQCVTPIPVPILASHASIPIAFPWTVKPGVTQVTVKADINNDVFESKEDNNSANLAMTAVAAPDFTISDLQIDPAGLYPGNVVQLQATVHNSGAALQTADVDVQFDFGIATTWGVAHFTPQANTAQVTARISAPMSVTVQTIDHVTATVDLYNHFDEVSKTNNSATKQLNVTIRPPDLTVTQISTPAQTVAIGSDVPITVTMKNLGGPIRGSAYLSLSIDDKLLGRSLVQFTGTANEEQLYTFHWMAEAGSSFRMTAYVEAYDSDPANDELTQTITSLKVLPCDLQVTKVDYTPTSNIKVNDTVTFAVTVKNAGAGDIQSRIPVYLEVSGLPANEGTQFINSLAGGASTVLTFTWTASEMTHPHAVAVIDPNQLIRESDKTNNALGVDLPFSIAKRDGFTLEVTPANQLCPLGQGTAFTARVKSWLSVPTLFDLSVTGVPSAWVSLSANQVYLQAGEWKDVTVTVTPPMGTALGDQALHVTATQHGATASHTVDATASIAASTTITNLLPASNQTFPSTTVAFTWQTPVSAGSEIFLKRDGSTTYQRYTGADGAFHRVEVPNLVVGAKYQFYAQSTAGSTAKSDERSFTISGGVAFAQKAYTAQIQRDYLQIVKVPVKNLGAQSMTALATVQNTYNPEIVVGFAGSGSEDTTLTLAPNETKELSLVIHAPFAARASYNLPILVKSGADAAPLLDEAVVNIQVPNNAKLELQELSTDPVTLIKRFRVINTGDDPVADLQITLDDQLKGKVIARPDLQMLRLGPKESVEFELVPVFQLTAHQNPAFAAKLSPNHAVRVDTPEAQRLRTQPFGGKIGVKGGNDSTSVDTLFNLGANSIFALELDNRHINLGKLLSLCTNVRSWLTDFIFPPLKPADPFLLVTMEPIDPANWGVLPHNVYFEVNGYPVGAINNEVPDGVYTFNVPASVLNISDTLTTSNQVEIDTSVYNAAHYFRVGKLEMHIFADKMVVYVAAPDEQTAVQIAENLPYFEAHNDPPMDAMLTIMHTKMEQNFQIENNNSYYFNSAAVLLYPAKFMGPGWYNNNVLLGNTDHQAIQSKRNNRCINLTDQLLRQFVKAQEGDAKFADLRMGICQSKNGGHTFPIMWQAGTNPMETGKVIDCWPNQRWEVLPISQVLNEAEHGYTFSPYMGFNVPSFPGNAAHQPVPMIQGQGGDDPLHSSYPSLSDDYQELMSAWQHYQNPNSNVMKPQPASQFAENSSLEVSRPEQFLVTVMGGAYPLVTDMQTGKRVGYLATGEFLDEVGHATVQCGRPPTAEVPVASILINAEKPGSYKVDLAPGQATGKVAMVTIYHDEKGIPQTAAYPDIAMGANSAARTAGGISLTCDFTKQPQPLPLPDGTKVYPWTNSTTGPDSNATYQQVHQVLSGGVKLLALPAWVMDKDVATLLDASDGNLTLARWNPEASANGKYVAYPDAFVTNPAPGQGYWVKLPRTTPLEFFGAMPPQDQPYVIHLVAGWNLIGNPFTSSIPWSLEQIKVRQNGVEQTLAQAQQANWIADYAWGWQPSSADPNTGAYTLVYDTSILAGVVGQLQPWQGYWVKVVSPCDLLLPPPNQSYSAAPKRRVDGAWNIRLLAKASSGAATTLTVGEGMPDRVLTIAAPPPAPGIPQPLQFTLQHGGLPLAVDVRQKTPGTQTWELSLNVDTSSNQSGDIELSWPDLRTLPKDISLTLVDLTTGERRYLRTTLRYVIPAALAAGGHRFQLLAEHGNLHLLQITGLQATATRAQGMRVNFTLTRPAKTTVTLRTVNGRLLKQLEEGHYRPAGTASFALDTRDGQGQLAPGVYLVQVQAIDEESRQVRASTMLMLK